MCEDLTIKNISGDLYRPIFLLSRMHTYSSLALCSLVRKQVQQRKLKTAKTPGKRTREKTSIFLAANLKLVNQADTRFVGILNRNIRICHFLDPNTLIAKTKSLKKQRALYRKKQAESFEISFYIGGFEPGLEYQRVLVLDVDSRATHLLQEEAFFKSWEKPKTRKAGAVQNFLQNNPATANFLLINTKTPKFSLIRTETVCGQKSD